MSRGVTAALINPAMTIRSHACNPSMNSNVRFDDPFQSIETSHSNLKRREALLACTLQPGPSSGACACLKWIAPMKLMQAVATAQ
jgi:hypothetical protein